MNILFLTNIPSPYRVAFFNELGKMCNLTVLFERENATNRNSKWQSEEFKHFKAVFLNGFKVKSDSSLSFEVIKYLNQNFDYIIVGGYSTPTGMLAVQYLKIKKIPFILNADGGLIKNDQGIMHKLKQYFISSASAWIVPSDEAKEYICHYGGKKDKVFIYPFTSLRMKDIMKEISTQDNKNEIRAQIGIKEEKVILSVGQFIHRKGFDVLIEASRFLSKEYGIYIIGDKPTQKYLDLKEKYGLNNLYFIDFQSKQELKKYYQAADLFAFPTREDIWGLVVNEAMANGLPVITTNKCVAGLELVHNDRNGYIIDTEDVHDLATKITKILSDSSIQLKMSKESLKIIKNYTIENMAREHIKILDEV